MRAQCSGGLYERLRLRPFRHRRGIGRRAGFPRGGGPWREGRGGGGISRRRHLRHSRLRAQEAADLRRAFRRGSEGCAAFRLERDRKSVGEGKRVAVRFERGGLRIIKKKKKKTN